MEKHLDNYKKSKKSVIHEKKIYMYIYEQILLRYKYLKAQHSIAKQ